jgi:hypothetical protein
LRVVTMRVSRRFKVGRLPVDPVWDSADESEDSVMTSPSRYPSCAGLQGSDHITDVVIHEA